MFHDFLFGYDKVGNLTSLQNNVQPAGSFHSAVKVTR
jgi:hypothetical protein